MRLLVLIVASLAPASSAAVQPRIPAELTVVELRKAPLAKDGKAALPGQKCPGNPEVRLTDGRVATTLGSTEVRNLGELPPGNLQLAVLRNVDGCVEPVIVRYGIGGTRLRTVGPAPRR